MTASILGRPSPRASVQFGQHERYPFNHLPQIDYAAHPAYGMALPRPTVRQRIAALAAFAKGLLIISLRLVSDYEHLPKLTGHAAKLRRFVTNSPVYARLISKQKWQRLVAANSFAPTTPEGRTAFEVLDRDGILGLDLAAGEKAEMRTLLATHFDTLQRRLAAKPPEQQHFDESRLWLDPVEHKTVFDWFTRTLARHGVIEASSAYLGRRVGIAHVNPQINRPTDNFWGNDFTDVGIGVSSCDYFHVDATYNVLKLIIYVNDVGPLNGPFSYVRGSHRVRRFWDGLVRRANDYGYLSSTRRPVRELFHALPRLLQRKGAFGADIPNDNAYAQTLLDLEWTVTSQVGDGILFDPCGIHRGGMVREGHRRVVTLLMAEIDH